MITVFVRKIEYFSNEEKDNIINSLSECALTRLNKKRNEDLHLASLCALSLLTNEQRANLSYKENGAPFFKTLDSDVSISHCKTYVAIAVSSSKDEPVGIDIEDNPMQINSRLPCVKGAGTQCLKDCYSSQTNLVGTDVLDGPLQTKYTRFLTQNEQSALENGTPYIKIWTKKEALYKYLKNDNTPFIKLDSTLPEQYGAKFITLPIEDNTLTVCAKKGAMIQLMQK